ncbi:hypothetical protein PAXINDRAFT_11288 [Paxillus involutus ATCC 200175]|uniref:Uncharacterized protein n=1 Tax=Paxillus involutus ATCC 200175 TaxID=664439 RepID=A0A0C9U8J8_PAXIN|nr:hypothetical protein PAXINDRAFT_11288 [Paxillus involutus ATCC 200175]
MKCDVRNLADPVPDKLEEHHIMGQSQNFPEDLTRFVQTNMGNPATSDFILKLRAHILPRIVAIHQEVNPKATLDMDVNLLDDSDDTTPRGRLSQFNHVLFEGNRIYRHHLLHINYTTYNLQHKFNSINPHTDHREIMLLSNSEGEHHPFSYAQVLRIFHANVMYTRPRSKDFQSH